MLEKGGKSAEDRGIASVCHIQKTFSTLTDRWMNRHLVSNWKLVAKKNERQKLPRQQGKKINKKKERGENAKKDQGLKRKHKKWRLVISPENYCRHRIWKIAGGERGKRENKAEIGGWVRGLDWQGFGALHHEIVKMKAWNRGTLTQILLPDLADIWYRPLVGTMVHSSVQNDKKMSIITSNSMLFFTK